MRNLKVRDLLVFSPAQPRVVQATATVHEVVELLLADRSTREVYLVDDDNRFFGVITLRRLARHAFTHDVPGQSATEMLDLVSARNADDLALKKAAYVALDDDLEDVLDVMFRFDINEVPVVDADKIVVGSLNMLDLVGAFYAGKLDGDDRPPALATRQL
jgi:CBS domain-containing protein